MKTKHFPTAKQVLVNSIDAEFRHLLRSVGLGARRRKFPHLPQFHKAHATLAMDEDAVRHIVRRAHGLGKDVAPAPSVVESAERNERGYMHAAARRRLDAALAALPDLKLRNLPARRAAKLLAVA